MSMFGKIRRMWASAVDRTLIGQLSDLGFTDSAQNIVLVGGTDYACNQHGQMDGEEIAAGD